jgi:hypothetical protein
VKTILSGVVFSQWYRRCSASVSGNADEAMILLPIGIWQGVRRRSASLAKLDARVQQDFP